MEELWFANHVFGTSPDLVVPTLVSERSVACASPGKMMKEFKLLLHARVLTVLVVEPTNEQHSATLLLGLNFAGLLESRMSFV